MLTIDTEHSGFFVVTRALANFEHWSFVAMIWSFLWCQHAIAEWTLFFSLGLLMPIFR